VKQIIFFYTKANDLNIYQVGSVIYNLNIILFQSFILHRNNLYHECYCRAISREEDEKVHYCVTSSHRIHW